jgi:uncharacterized RDD family membrane protein YckC
MNILKRLLPGLIPALLCVVCGLALAKATDSDSANTDSDHSIEAHRHHHFHHTANENQIMTVGSDAHLPAGSSADSVVSIFGSAISDGEAGEVLSLFGSTRVTGPVANDATAVFGSTYIDSKVDGDVMALFGDLELGPHAEVTGDAVTVGGTLNRDPAAIVHGEVKTILMSHVNAHFEWLRTWVRHCLLYGRPLAIAPGLGWAWSLALSFLALYLGLAALFPTGMTRCVQTFEAQPGHSLIASVLGVLGAPVVLVLLCITVVGIAAIPFLAAALFCAGLFGNAVMLAWLGGRVLRRRDAGASSHPALAVLVGGLMVLVLYLVPVVGFLIKLLTFVGFGVVVLTLIQAVGAKRAESRGKTSDSPPPDGVTPAGLAAPSSTAEPAVPAAVNSASLPRAGFWIRMLALLIDIILVGIVLHIVDHAANLELLVLAGYGAVMWKLRGATIGGIVFDLQVLRHDGREVDWATAIVRALGCFLSLAAAGLGFIWIAFDGGKQGWHDKIAGTVVVRTTKRISLV